MKFDTRNTLGKSLHAIFYLEHWEWGSREQQAFSQSLKRAAYSLFGNKDILKSPYVKLHDSAKVELYTHYVDLGDRRIKELSEVIIGVSIAIPLKVPVDSPLHDLRLNIDYGIQSQSPDRMFLSARLLEEGGWVELTAGSKSYETREVLLKLIKTYSTQAPNLETSV